jgi:hypothetical protein
MNNTDISFNEAIVSMAIASGAMDETNVPAQMRKAKQAIADYFGKAVTQIDFDRLRDEDEVDAVLITIAMRAQA